MINRIEAVKFWKDHLDKFRKVPLTPHPKRTWTCDAWHIGRVELKEFMDLLYDGPPTCEEERLK